MGRNDRDAKEKKAGASAFTPLLHFLFALFQIAAFAAARDPSSANAARVAHIGLGSAHMPGDGGPALGAADARVYARSSSSSASSPRSSSSSRALSFNKSGRRRGRRKGRERERRETSSSGWPRPHSFRAKGRRPSV